MSYMFSSTNISKLSRIMILLIDKKVRTLVSGCIDTSTNLWSSYIVTIEYMYTDTKNFVIIITMYDHPFHQLPSCCSNTYQTIYSIFVRGFNGLLFICVKYLFWMFISWTERTVVYNSASISKKV